MSGETLFVEIILYVILSSSLSVIAVLACYAFNNRKSFDDTTLPNVKPPKKAKCCKNCGYPIGPDNHIYDLKGNRLR